MSNILLGIIACGALSIVYAFITSNAVMGSDAGNARMQEIAGAIREGAQAYLKRQYATIGVVGIVILALAWWLLGEAPTRMALLRLVLALAGVALVLGRPGMPWPVPESLSDWLALAAGASFALTNALLRRWRDTPSGARALAMFGGGAVTASAVALGATALGLTGAVPTPTSAWLPWLALLMAGFLASNLALQYGAARLPAQTTALIMLSEVVIASAAAVALGAARLEATTLLGGLLIVGAALLAVARR